MFYGQIVNKKYLEDPSISFCGVGDCFYDDAPLQITDFGQGKQIDQMISKLYLEGGGGGSFYETYEMAAYFYSTKCDLTKPKKSYFFFTGLVKKIKKIKKIKLKNLKKKLN
jgi:hypothetical protein